MRVIQAGGVELIEFHVANAATRAPRHGDAITTGTDALEDCIVTGRCNAKVKGAVPGNKIRTIVPVPVILRIVDVSLTGEMNAIVDDVSAGCSSAFYEVARKHRQVGNLTFGLQNLAPIVGPQT